MSTYEQYLASLTIDQLAAECLKAWRVALGSRDRRRTDLLWFVCKERHCTKVWAAAQAQALAERRAAQEVKT